jgi:predicted Zn-dependent peptidase
MLKPLALTFVAASIVGFCPLDAQNFPPIREHTLKNGMKVLLVERHDEPNIACGWVARVGSSNESAGTTGLAHFFEHMMFKGTKVIGTKDAVRDAELNDLQDAVFEKIREENTILREKQRRGEIKNMKDPAARTPRLQALLDELDALVKEQHDLIVKDEFWHHYEVSGATGLNANTSNDRTFYHITVPANKLELWALLESDRLLNPVFREFYSEREVVLSERKQTTESRPDGLINEAFGAMTDMASPYRWPVLGWPSDVIHVTRKQANEFFATYYAPNNITAILVGNFKSDNAIALMEKYFGRIPTNSKGVPEIVTEELVQPAERRMIGQAQTMPYISIQFSAVPEVHVDAPALEVLSGVFTGGTGSWTGRPSGRLGRSLVLEQQAAIQAYGYFWGQKLGGAFMFRVAPVPGTSPETIEPLIYAEIDKIVKEGITDEELARVKNAEQMSFFMQQDSNGGLRNALAEAESAGTYKDLLEGYKRLQAVTKEDVQRVAREYLVKERSNVLIVTRPEADGSGSMTAPRLPSQSLFQQSQEVK